MAQVQLEKVSKQYAPDAVAVREFTLNIADGEFVVFVGPSGCGKSTTLRMIAGLEEISSGSISIGGRVVNDVHPKDRDIAMVFQNYALYPHMSVYENMALALKLRKVAKPEIQNRVMAAAKMLGLELLLERKPGQLSGGQRQRVAVGRAIVRQPKAFLFDEPLSNLDAKLRVTTRAEIKALHQRLKTTTVYVTHDQEEAMTLGDRIVVMAGGIIQQAAPPLEVYHRPVNRFVAGFVGIPPMNFAEGNFVATSDGSGVRFLMDGDQSLNLAPRHTDRVRSMIGQRAVLGIRPQYLSPVAGAQPGATLALTVDIVEPLGESTDVVCRASDGNKIVARLSADRTGTTTAQLPKPGDRLHFACDMAQAHFFALGEYGANLTLDR